MSESEKPKIRWVDYTILKRDVNGDRWVSEDGAIRTLDAQAAELQVAKAEIKRLKSEVESLKNENSRQRSYRTLKNKAMYD